MISGPAQYNMTKMNYAQTSQYLAGQIGLLKMEASVVEAFVADNCVQIFGGRGQLAPFHPSLPRSRLPALLDGIEALTLLSRRYYEDGHGHLH